MPLIATNANTSQNYRRMSTADTNSALVKGGVANLYAIVISNTNAAGRYVKLYDKLTAPTVGTDTPVMTIFAPPGQTIALPVGGDRGAGFTLGLGIGITTGVADNDVGAVAANEVIVHLAFR